MAVQGLIILSGAVPGIRDLMWVADGDFDGLGYVPFRSEGPQGPWLRLSPFPIPGNRYRDETTLEEIRYEVQDTDWVERGEQGLFGFKVPDTPLYAKILDGRAILATQPTHATVWIDDKRVAPVRIDPMEGVVWMPNAFALVSDADRKERMLPQVKQGSKVVIYYKKLTNFVNPTPEDRAYYTVVPVLANGQLAHQPGAPGSEVFNILEVDKMDFMQAEMVRRNAFLFERRGEPSHLLIRRSRGKRCGCITEGQARTACTSCYETGFVGGFYGPYDLLFIDPDSGASKELEEGGVKVTRTSRSMLGPTPVLQAGDMIIRKNGERLIVANPVYKADRGVLLQQEYDAVLLPSGDTRYRVPLRPPLQPETYDPRFQPTPPDAAGEPVVNPTTDPTKTWENDKVVPQGRTVIFGNIQT